MGVVVYVPFVAALAVATLSRLASSRLWPRAAVPAIAAAAVALALSTVGAVVLLACPLPAQVPFVAALGRWRPTAVAEYSPTPAWVSVIALVVLVALAWRAVRELRTLAAELGDAARLQRTIRERSNTGVAVIDDPVPAAHAVSGVVTSGGAVVITSSMLVLLDADEKAAVIAHERAHLRQHHAVFMAAVRLCSALNPLSASMVRDLQFALERWADEDAAATTGRTTLASALAKAALAVLDSAAELPAATGPAFHRHGVTDRVAALLAEPNRRSRPAWALVALSLAAALALASATHNTEQFFEAVRVWSHR